LDGMMGFNISNVARVERSGTRGTVTSPTKIPHSASFMRATC